MAKGKKSTEEIEDIPDEDLEDDFFSDSDEDLPDLSEVTENGEEIGSEEETDEFPLEEEEEEIKDYKFLKARLLEVNNNNHRIEFIGVSHGFLNYLIFKLLKEKGVTYAAYKETTLNPAVLTVITDGSIHIRKILKNACANMKAEVLSLKENVQKTIN
ncbi:MAG: RpoL/Rpb11 RNA polymerase subunit family protein [Promethearchaeota archaeon]